MQVNIALAADNEDQAKRIREAWYPGASARQIRDAYLFNCALDRYQGAPEELLPFIENEKGTAVVKRMLTIKADSYERLNRYRAIIRCTAEKLIPNQTAEKEANGEPADVSRLILEKLSKLEKQLEECNNTRREIRELLEHK